MKAITLHRPWPAAIFHLPGTHAKRVENRGWRPPRAIVGQRIAVHAGITIDRGALTELRRTIGARELRDEVALATGIIGTAVVVGVTYQREVEQRVARFVDSGPQTADDMRWWLTVHHWFVGPFGWLLDDARPCPTPIPCQGRQGLWNVPADVAMRLG